MNRFASWKSIRDERAGGKAAIEAEKRELVNEVIRHRLAEVRWSRGRVSQIERGEVSGQKVIAHYATTMGGRLRQAIHFDDGDISAMA